MPLIILYLLLLETALALLIFSLRDAFVSLRQDPYELQLTTAQRRLAELVRIFRSAYGARGLRFEANGHGDSATFAQMSARRVEPEEISEVPVG
jgi:hypothetical protein